MSTRDNGSINAKNGVPTLLAVGNEGQIREYLRAITGSSTLNVVSATEPEELKRVCEEMADETPPLLAVVHGESLIASPIEILDALSVLPTRPTVVFLSAEGNPEILFGSGDRPNPDLDRAVDSSRFETGDRVSRPGSVRTTEGLDPFLGTSESIKTLENMARRARRAISPLLISGETGSGKGLLAEWLHRNGPRSGGPFVALNCAGLSPQLLESELFGHVKGAFTGAVARKRGLMEVADQGTIFLDEIGDTDRYVQSKILKAVEEKRFRAVGATAERQVDVRLISATSRDLPLLVERGEFRSDLYYRISAIPLRVPSLRERFDDPQFVHQLFQDLAERLERPGMTLSIDAFGALAAYRWPGNFRELNSVLERSILLTDDDVVLEDTILDVLGSVPPIAERQRRTLLEVERHHIEETVRNADWNVEKAAMILGVSRSTLYEKLSKYKIRRP